MGTVGILSLVLICVAFPLSARAWDDDAIKSNMETYQGALQTWMDGFFRMQVGAIVKFVCRIGPTGAFRWENLDKDIMYIGWFIDTRPVDDHTFPAKTDYDIYTSDRPWKNFGKLYSTLTYTARMEDNKKRLTCALKRGPDYESISSVDISSVFSSHEDGYKVAGLTLLIYPAPKPQLYRSKVVTTWTGGLYGTIKIPIESHVSTWKMVLTFPRKVFRLEGGGFNVVAPEPCLHNLHCPVDKHVWIIYNVFSNRVLSPGMTLSIDFIAKVWNKNKDKMRADVEFYGYAAYATYYSDRLSVPSVDWPPSVWPPKNWA